MDNREQVKFVKLLDCDLPKRVFCGPLSRDTYYSLSISGPVRPAELRNLIKLLELQIEWLAEDARLAPGGDGKE